MVLPTLVYDGKSKTNNDVLIYANLGVGILKKQLGFGTSQTVTPCVSGETCPAGSFDATVINVPNKGAVGAIPAESPLFTAAEGEQAPTVEGDTADVICLPDYAQNFLICYDQGIQVTVGQTFRAIPRKYNPTDHTVRQRGDFSLTLNDLMVSSWKGIQRIRGRRCTIIVEIRPGGGANIQEIQYYTNVVLNVPPMNSAADGNASIEISGQGSFSFCAVFSAPVV